VQSALTAPCRSSCRTVEDFLDCHADHRLPRSVGTLAAPRWSSDPGEGHAVCPHRPHVADQGLLGIVDQVLQLLFCPLAASRARMEQTSFMRRQWQRTRNQ
jgi:hypothetical protein